jgi:hypothetical protein
MKKLLLIIGLCLSTNAIAEPYKYLHYKYNDNVVVTISNIDCPLPEHKNIYNLTVVATRIDGERLLGCYAHEGDDIVIQWFKGDKSKFPANVFLTNPKLDNTYKKDLTQ